MTVDPRRLAALDMYGTRGSIRRRQIIRAEFVVGVVLCTALGGLTLLSAGGTWLLVGIWLIGTGANYVPLTLAATALSRPGELEAELRDVDVSAECRRAGRVQLWIAVPFAICVFALLKDRVADR
jgi:hypothetical protein